MIIYLQRSLIVLFIAVVGVWTLAGCAPQDEATTTQETTQAAGCIPQDEITDTEGSTRSINATKLDSEEMKNLPCLEGKATVVMTVKGSPITIEVDGDNAPITAGNFVDLVAKGVYDGVAFHRVVREPQPFVVQGGDPQSKDPDFPLSRLGTGGYTPEGSQQPRYIPLEIKPEAAEEPVYHQTLKKARVASVPVLNHRRGAVAMARSQMPDSASSQFYFALASLPFLDGDYAVFGYVTEGMDIIDKIQQGDRIESAKVTQGLENLQQPTK